MLALSIEPANLPLDRFPEYTDPLEDTLAIMTDIAPKPSPLARLQSDGTETSRGASPQPSHISIPLPHNGHKILRSATVGYIAPEFVGKLEQMKSGMCFENFP